MILIKIIARVARVVPVCCRRCELHDTYGTSNGQQALGDLGNVAALVKINGLEHIDLGHSPSLASLLETIDVLHLLELGSHCVDLRDASGHQLVHEAVEEKRENDTG